MRIEVGAATDIGRVREVNEDSFLVEAPLYAVADGMGGHKGGDVASSLALETVEAMFREGDGTLADQVREANRAVHERSVADQKVRGMGTTLTAVTIEGSDARFVHVGDSRAYLLRAGDLRQVTSDHTLVARMVKAGEISREEAAVHPHRNVVTKVIGTDATVVVDEHTVPLLDGDRLLLCSDGLTGMVAEDQIQAILEAEPDPQRAADRMVKAANRAGGIDNITVLVLDAHAEQGDPPPGQLPSLSRRPSARRVVAGALIVIVVLVAALFGVRAYVDRQWYVGEADGKVAVFRGIPARPLGITLSDLDTQTEIAAAEVEALPVYGGLPEGISAESRDDAFAIVEQMRADLVEQAAAQEPAGGGSGAGGGGGSGGGSGGGGGSG
jgi:serine/threonine protein phosphatase PrpC